MIRIFFVHLQLEIVLNVTDVSEKKICVSRRADIQVCQFSQIAHGSFT